MPPGATAAARNRLRSRSNGRVLLRSLGLALWSVAWLPALALPPGRAAAWVAALTAAVVWWYLLRTRPPARARDRAMLRLRGLGRGAPWFWAVVPAWIVFQLALASLSARWHPPPVLPPGLLERYAEQPMAWLPLALIGLAMAPVVEEVLFRGVVQRDLETRLGPVPGILLTAVAFAAFHLEPWRFGYLLAGGLVFGAFVHAARSLWAGILLHASANASGAAADILGLSPVGGNGGSAPELATAAASLVVLLVLLRRVHRSARARPS